MQVRDIMTQPVRTVENTTTVAQAAREMAEHNISALAVRLSNRVVGIITARDIVARCVARGLAPAETTVGSIMSPHPVTVGPEESITRLAHLLAQHRVHRLPVVADGQLVGIVSATDIARHYKEEGVIGEMAHALAQPAHHPAPC